MWRVIDDMYEACRVVEGVRAVVKERRGVRRKGRWEVEEVGKFGFKLSRDGFWRELSAPPDQSAGYPIFIHPCRLRRRNKEIRE